MKRRTAGIVLAGLMVLVPLSHVQWQPLDDGGVLLVDGRAVDVRGQISQAWTRWVRDCWAVQAVGPQEPLYAQTLQALRGYSPPDSQSAQLRGVWRQGQWLLAEVGFERLHPAVLLLHGSQGRAPVIVPEGVWSGPTHPHLPQALIRRFLSQRVPQAPAALLDCYEGV